MAFVNESHFYRPISLSERKAFTVKFMDVPAGTAAALTTAQRTVYDTGSGSKDISANCSALFDYEGVRAITVADIWAVGDTPAVGIYRLKFLITSDDTTIKQEANVIAHIV